MSDETWTPPVILDLLAKAWLKETGYTGQPGRIWWDGERIRFEEIDLSPPASIGAAQAAKRTQSRS